MSFCTQCGAPEGTCEHSAPAAQSTWAGPPPGGGDPAPPPAVNPPEPGGWAGAVPPNYPTGDPTVAAGGPGWPPNGGQPGEFPGQPTYWPPAPMPQKSRAGRTIAIVAASVVGLLVVLIVIGVVAGSNSNKKVPQAIPSANGPDTPAGYKSFSDPTEKFTISVPSSWVSIDPSGPDAARAFSDVEANNPNLKSVLGSDPSQLAAKGMAFLGVDATSDNGQADNVNVVASSAPGYTPDQLSDVRSVIRGELTKLGATSEGITDVTFAGQPALRSADTLPVKSADGSTTTAHQVQYYVGRNDIVYVITLSGSSPELDKIATTFRITS